MKIEFKLGVSIFVSGCTLLVAPGGLLYNVSWTVSTTKPPPLTVTSPPRLRRFPRSLNTLSDLAEGSPAELGTVT